MKKLRKTEVAKLIYSELKEVLPAKLAKSITDDLSEEIIDKIKEYGPTWESTYVSLSERGGLYISFTDEEEYDRFISWKTFESKILDDERLELFKQSLPYFERLVANMRKITQMSDTKFLAWRSAADKKKYPPPHKFSGIYGD